ncbi:four helix bundle protein [Candidatus Saccharibacteria bacterium]|jgi:four helix bundle protein|nr:four helix bundle protein [Candidatus Saccharibacteria bacterium]
MEGRQKIQSYTDLIVWQESRKLAALVYRLVKQFPPEEMYGLSSQIKRAAVSVPSNIAEGFGRASAKEKNQFYYIANGSLVEAETQAYIAHDVGFFNQDHLQKLLEQTTKTQKLLYGLIKANKERL